MRSRWVGVLLVALGCGFTEPPLIESSSSDDGGESGDTTAAMPTTNPPTSGDETADDSSDSTSEGPSDTTDAGTDTDTGTDSATGTDTDSGTDTDGSSSSDGDSSSTGSMGCAPPDHTPCDDENDLHPVDVIGLECPGDPPLTVLAIGAPEGLGVRTGFGGTNNFDPTEGERFAVIGSGIVTELDQETPPGDSNVGPTYCNDDLGDYDQDALPAPLTATATDGNCVADPTLIGTGDCSQTLEPAFENISSVNDYTAMRIEGSVPGNATSLSFDIAFMSTEYPFYLGGTFTDMTVAWLISERWTGNVTYSESGVLSVDSDLLTITDDAGTSPILAGTCMRQHAASPWLTTTAPVAPDEQFSLEIAVFDASDSIVDAFAFIDNVRFGCEDIEEPITAIAP